MPFKSILSAISELISGHVMTVTAVTAIFVITAICFVTLVVCDSRLVDDHEKDI